MQNLGIKVANGFNKIYWSVLSGSAKFVMYVICKIRNTELRKNAKFYGLMKFVNGTKNKIIIGRGCTIRSKAKSNLVGINRPYIFSSIGKIDSELKIGDDCGFSGTAIGYFNIIIIGNNVKCGANTLNTRFRLAFGRYKIR